LISLIVPPPASFPERRIWCPRGFSLRFLALDFAS
jgi:hypothetical protein